MKSIDTTNATKNASAQCTHLPQETLTRLNDLSLHADESCDLYEVTLALETARNALEDRQESLQPLKEQLSNVDYVAIQNLAQDMKELGDLMESLSSH